MCETPPLSVEVTRGTEVESAHLVDAVIIERDGVIVAGWGDPARPVLPRSALKPIQAVPLVETGAAARFGLGDVELALACASHDGEPDHIAAIERWVARIRLDESALACGAHPPGHAPSARAQAEAGIEPGPRHNNCSGKHLGFLTICRHLDLTIEGYLRADHPVHVDHVTPTIERLCGIDVGDQTPAIDGCGIPVWTVPLDRLAGGWARLAELAGGRRLIAAMRAEPFFVAGSTRACTRMIRSAEATTVVKTGAEGVFCGAVVDRGLGVALKTRDGGHRAAEAAIEWILAELGVLEPTGPGRVTNWAGTTVGEIRVATTTVGS